MSDGLSQSDIDALLSAAAEVPAADSPHPAVGSKAQAASRQRSIRPMDFSRPSKFNRDQLRTLHMLHEAFCRRISTYLSGQVRTLAEVSVETTDQIPYGEFVQSNPAPSFNGVLELSPLGTNGMLVADLPLMFAVLDRMLGGQGTSIPKTRDLTDIELRLAETIVGNILYELTQSWSELVNVAFRLRGIEMNAQFAQVAAPSDPTVVIRFRLSVGNHAGHMAVCLPYRSIEAIVGDLTAHRYFSQSGDDGSARRKILGTLRRVAMPVRAVVGEVNLPVDSVLGLKAGDVLPLGRRVEDGMTLVVGETDTWRAHPGRDGKRLAVRIERADEGAQPSRSGESGSSGRPAA